MKSIELSFNSTQTTGSVDDNCGPEIGWTESVVEEVETGEKRPNSDFLSFRPFLLCDPGISFPRRLLRISLSWFLGLLSFTSNPHPSQCCLKLGRACPLLCGACPGPLRLCMFPGRTCEIAQ